MAGYQLLSLEVGHKKGRAMLALPFEVLFYRIWLNFVFLLPPFQGQQTY